MQAKLVRTLPGSDGWFYELKLDGYRALAIRDGERLSLEPDDARTLGRI